MQILSRDEFKEAVFKRDGYKCVVCRLLPSEDAHHILDRSLWNKESLGYLIDNGVSLCSDHHLEAEKTLISCEQLRKAAGITNIVMPEHFFEDERYDHWGNIILPSGARIKGELFGEENVQRILKQADVLKDFLKYIKYPRTYHCSWSENLQNDDRMHQDISFFDGKEVIGSIKVDGECTSLYSDYIHARSIDSKHHESRSWVKKLHGQIAHEIPKGYRICGENMYAKHSIHYKHLLSYFYVYSVWDENNTALTWDETVEWSYLLNLLTVPVFYRGIWDKEKVHEGFLDYQKRSLDPVEGYVIRLAGRIVYKDYRRSYMKFVRKDHVQTSEFWMTEPVVPNILG